MRKFFDENNYPMNKEYILRNSIRKIGFWEMIKRNSIENKLIGLRKSTLQENSFLLLLEKTMMMLHVLKKGKEVKTSF